MASLSSNFCPNHLSFPQTTHFFCNSFKAHRNHLPILKAPFFLEIRSFLLVNSLQDHFPILKTASVFKMRSSQLSDPLQNRLPILKTASVPKIQSTRLANPPQHQLSVLNSASFLKIPSTHLPAANQNHLSTFKSDSSVEFSAAYPLQNPLAIFETTSFLKIFAAHILHPLHNHLSIFKSASFLLLVAHSVPFPSFAAETVIPTEPVSDKINIESILISIDDFFNRNPFFVAGVTFVWLVVVPLAQDYLKKFKYIPALDAFRKLKNDPNVQLLDIRNSQSISYLGSPNLKILMKNTVQVEFSEGKEEEFVKEVLKKLGDPGNTIICILDNFDGNSLKVAELLFKSGFKEAYAIKGGLRGKDGWQEIQEKYLPPSTHVYIRKKGKRKTAQKLDVSRERIDEKSSDDMMDGTSIPLDEDTSSQNGYVKPIGAAPKANLQSEKPLSPYPNYPDMKPPSSPTPSQPQS